METNLKDCERAISKQRGEVKEMRREFERVNRCVVETMGDGKSQQIGKEGEIKEVRL